MHLRSAVRTPLVTCLAAILSLAGFSAGRAGTIAIARDRAPRPVRAAGLRTSEPPHGEYRESEAASVTWIDPEASSVDDRLSAQPLRVRGHASTDTSNVGVIVTAPTWVDSRAGRHLPFPDPPDVRDRSTAPLTARGPPAILN
jgi:hypothetical protein